MLAPPTVATRRLFLPFLFIELLPSLGCSIPAHGQDAGKADRFSLPGLWIIQVVGGRAPLAPISHKHSTPSPLPG